jgi:hypothetical protein
MRFLFFHILSELVVNFPFCIGLTPQCGTSKAGHIPPSHSGIHYVQMFVLKSSSTCQRGKASTSGKTRTGTFVRYWSRESLSCNEAQSSVHGSTQAIYQYNQPS